MIQLFPDQLEAKQGLYKAIANGYRRPLIVAPTGWGKGTVAGDIIHGAVAKGNSVLFIVNRRELVRDMSRRLSKLGINHGILMGEKTRGTHLQVLVASADTYRNHVDRIKTPQIVFVDEAHLFVSKKAKEMILALSKKGALVILMTATPWRLDRKGLNEIADTMIEGPQVSTLIETGRLSAPVVYAPAVADLSSVKRTSSGEFDEDEAAQVMSTKKLVGDIVKHWRQLAYGRKTVGFAVNRKTAEEYALAFREAGIPSVAVDANTKDAERDKIWTDLAAGNVLVWSVGIISYGWDVPAVDGLILARPTMSLALHLQQCGRGLRAFPGKRDCLILDHAGNTLRHGLPDDTREWSLRGRKKKEIEEAKIAPLPLVCPNCTQVLRAGSKSCQCGYVFSFAEEKPKGDRSIKIEEGELVRVQSRVYIYPDTTGDIGRDQLIGIAEKNGYNPKWIEYRTKALNDARLKYRAHFNGEEPREHWNAAQINGIIENDVQRAKSSLFN